MRFDPELFEERMSGVGKSDQKLWDKVLLAFVGIAFFAWLAVMGVDRRFHVSRVPLWLDGVGAVMLLLSFGIFYLTFRENTYLSPAVRIQKERSQVVVSTGPYARVRHPLYARFVLYALGTALLLGSWLGVVGALLLGPRGVSRRDGGTRFARGARRIQPLHEPRAVATGSTHLVEGEQGLNLFSPPNLSREHPQISPALEAQRLRLSYNEFLSPCLHWHQRAIALNRAFVPCTITE
jgi:protein-S-isoprenylcysteine O-methyltransferase Ste14